MSHHLDIRLATCDPRLNIADVYLFDSAPDRTVMVMTCGADAALSGHATFHPAASYEFRFDTTGDGRGDTVFQVCFTDPIRCGEQDPYQEFTVHYETGVDRDVDPAGKLVFSGKLNTPGRVGVIDGFAGLVGEMWMPDQERFALYLRPDEMHTAFNFDFLSRPWEAGELRASIDLTLSTHVPIGASPTWVLSNHDVTRPVTKYGRPDTSFSHQDRKHGMRTDLVLGERRARAAALLAMALPGGLYVYQGEELGLPEVEDLPDELRQDPIFARSHGTDRGRDGCRVPLPWSGKEPPFGFGAGTPWLPQPADWKNLTAESQQHDQNSMLTLYRTALKLRRSLLGDGTLTWLDSPPGVLTFRRENLTCITNLTDTPIPLPPHQEILLTSIPLNNSNLPTDATAWIL